MEVPAFTIPDPTVLVAAATKTPVCPAVTVPVVTAGRLRPANIFPPISVHLVDTAVVL